jgi:NTE family protein
MTSLTYDQPTTVAGRLERRFRRIMTKRSLAEVKRVAARGARVHFLGPTAEDLSVIGVNLMDPARRVQVLETSLRTSAAALADAAPAA